MIKRSNDRIWIQFPESPFLLMAEGFTHLEEVCRTTFLETPHLDSPVCTREILYHTAHLEFAGYRLAGNTLHMHIHSRYLARGEDAKVTLILGSRTDRLTGQAMNARRVTGYLCLENPGSGEGVMGSYFKGKIVFASAPEKGIYIEDTQMFIPNN